MIQNNVKKFRPIHGLSFTQQSNFDMLNNFLRNQLKTTASVPDFSSTSVKNWAVWKNIVAKLVEYQRLNDLVDLSIPVTNVQGCWTVTGFYFFWYGVFRKKFTCPELTRSLSGTDGVFWEDEKWHLQCKNINWERTFINLMGVS